MIKNLEVPRSEDVRIDAVQAIINQLGIARAAFFFKEAMFQKEDYLKIKEKIFGERTAEEIYNEIINQKSDGE